MPRPSRCARSRADSAGSNPVSPTYESPACRRGPTRDAQRAGGRWATPALGRGARPRGRRRAPRVVARQGQATGLLVRPTIAVLHRAPAGSRSDESLRSAVVRRTTSDLRPADSAVPSLRLTDPTFQGASQLDSGGDAELGEGPVEVRADRAVGEVEHLSDFAVGQSLRGHLGDLELLWREFVSGVRGSPCPRCSRKSSSYRSRFGASRIDRAKLVTPTPPRGSRARAPRPGLTRRTRRGRRSALRARATRWPGSARSGCPTSRTGGRWRRRLRSD
jgi:hypothetical protein